MSFLQVFAVIRVYDDLVAYQRAYNCYAGGTVALPQYGLTQPHFTGTTCSFNTARPLARQFATCNLAHRAAPCAPARMCLSYALYARSIVCAHISMRACACEHSVVPVEIGVLIRADAYTTVFVYAAQRNEHVIGARTSRERSLCSRNEPQKLRSFSVSFFIKCNPEIIQLGCELKSSTKQALQV